MKKNAVFLKWLLILSILFSCANAQSVLGAAETSSPIGQLLADRIDNHFDAAVAEYVRIPASDHGKVLNVDIARELSPEYRENPNLASSVQQAASRFIKKYYLEKLLEKPLAGAGILVTAGGPGSGKTTVLNNLLYLPDQMEIIYDTTLNNIESARFIIDHALQNKRNVTILYVYRPPVDSFVNGVLPRAMKTGRVVPVEYFSRSHAGARETISWIEKTYAENPGVQVIAVDNSSFERGPVLVALDTIPYMSAERLLPLLVRLLEQEKQAGRISEGVYLHTK